MPRQMRNEIQKHKKPRGAVSRRGFFISYPEKILGSDFEFEVKLFYES